MPSLAILCVHKDMPIIDSVLLRQIFGDAITIKSYAIGSDLDVSAVTEDLALIIGPEVIAKEMISRLPSGVKHVVKKRALDPTNLHLLFQIPANAEVLVVNDLYETACEMVNELKELNIHPLRYFPYNPQDPEDPYHLRTSYVPFQLYSPEITRKMVHSRQYENKYETPPYSGQPIQYAITAGEPNEVPKAIPNVIDLGHLLINIMTIVEILYHFRGVAGFDPQVGNQYLRLYINLSMELAKKHQQNLFLQAQLTSVIANMQNGILLVNEDNEILLFNEKAVEIMGKRELMSVKITDILPVQALLDTGEEQFIPIKNHTIHLTQTEIAIPHTEQHCHLIILESLEQIQEIDQRYRKQIIRGNKARYLFKDIVYQSQAMRKTMEKAAAFAKTDSTILITGESGTGKELLAQAIHNASRRRRQPFIAINCGALTESLLESELFGYEEGAFTGAKKGGKAGLFELAHQGTLFLDEIGDTPKSIQVKLLRALQEKEILRVGGHRMIPVDVRILAATNQNLHLLQQQGLFRQDLYYRLNTLPLSMPPLRRRSEDIRPLFFYLLDKAATLAPASESSKGKEARPPQHFLSDELLAVLENHSWPGNVRELENIVAYIASIGPLTRDITADVAALLSAEEPPSSLSPLSPLSPPLGAAAAVGSSAGAQAQARFTSVQARDECRAILTALQAAKARDLPYAGRGFLQQSLRDNQGLDLSLSQIRLRLNNLKTLNFVGAETGKGHFILPAGEDWLANAAGIPQN